jgi:hypothetical protein
MITTADICKQHVPYALHLFKTHVGRLEVCKVQRCGFNYNKRVKWKKRSFTIISVNDKRRAKGTPVSTFWSRNPAGAARKAGTSICRKSAKRGQCTLKLGIKTNSFYDDNGIIYLYDLVEDRACYYFACTNADIADSIRQRLSFIWDENDWEELE